ncbi:hypothetical protein B9Z35_07210 [Limnohabitans sp. Jir61]|uniref:restriction endonuclease subunit S n=1 Tax=Limnohabitans sp. Jir61 TaxID=1826168 RepID=UPI000D3DC776|nr:restriction endonuclease subunit S [Limnohabitans sp. Jir61]PUE30833.1 hypothetical protein B9Z35_07210 [Limnohabitans sp. Jir61]
MSSKTAWLTLSEIVEDIIDRRGVTPLKLGGDFCDAGHRVISAKVLKNRKIDLDADEARYVDSAIYKKWMKSPLQKDDVLMTSEAPLGELAYLNKDTDWVLGQRLFAIRPKKSVMSGRFLYYVLQTQNVRADIFGRASGTTVQGIRQAELRMVKVPVPPMPQQLAVSDFLGNIDDRISLLNETAATLEGIALAIFKCWFLDFEPVRAKVDGQTVEGLDKSSAELFPNSFQSKNDTAIPEGWSVKTMGEVSSVGIGKTPPRKEQQWFSSNASDVRWASIRDMGYYKVFATKTNEYLTKLAIDKFNVRVVPDNTTLMSFKMTIGRLAITDGEMATNEAIAHFKLEKNSVLTSEYIYLHLKHFDFSSLSSTSSIADAVNSKTVREIPILVPDKRVVELFQNRIAPIFSSIKNITSEIETLTNIRDTLLSRLISGDLQIALDNETLESFAD